MVSDFINPLISSLASTDTFSLDNITRYIVQPLNPTEAGDNWINTRVEPLTIGLSYGPETSDRGRDPMISYNVECWLKQSVGIGKNGQIHRNDGLLNMIMSLAGIYKFCRNATADETTTTVNSSLKPNFVMLHRGVGILIAEEKEGSDLQAAKEDIVNKFGWIPHVQRLPFFIGIAFCETEMEVVSISPHKVISTLFHGPCRDITERSGCLGPAVNIARVLKYWIGNGFICPIGLSMGSWHKRDCGKSIRIIFQGVQIQYPDRKTFLRLKQFYEKCRNVPNLEQMIQCSTCRMTLLPVGVTRMPRDHNEFLEAIQCVLIAVDGIHRQGYYHTDIRWANIVFIPTSNSWVLIDCYETVPKNDNALCATRIRERAIQGASVWTEKHDIDYIVRLFDIYTTLPSKLQRLKNTLKRLTNLKNIRRVLQS